MCFNSNDGTKQASQTFYSIKSPRCAAVWRETTREEAEELDSVSSVSFALHCKPDLHLPLVSHQCSYVKNIKKSQTQAEERRENILFRPCCSHSRNVDTVNKKGGGACGLWRCVSKQHKAKDSPVHTHNNTAFLINAPCVRCREVCVNVVVPSSTSGWSRCLLIAVCPFLMWRTVAESPVCRTLMWSRTHTIIPPPLLSVTCGLLQKNMSNPICCNKYPLLPPPPLPSRPTLSGLCGCAASISRQCQAASLQHRLLIPASFPQFCCLTPALSLSFFTCLLLQISLWMCPGPRGSNVDCENLILCSTLLTVSPL